MSLNYDFDIVTIAPDEVDPEHGFASMTGTRPVRAVFRDFQTAEALRSASPKIRRIFLESGFSLETRETGVGRGFYRAEDAEARQRVLKRLFTNIRNMGVQGEYCGDFDFWSFLEQTRNAQPLPASGRKEFAPVADQTETQRQRRPIAAKIGIAIGVALVLFALLKLLAAQGANP
ncbi:MULTISPECIES: hypothetical protein [unclassified Ruegeria]|uniref:hypothetical protein n=1 Tax=unclassified Ruegeria TaxID=2625375 RepID=UPI00148788F5|nr:MULTISPECIES: hypothetical protein [unclassified Ruegeria]